jgi:hypothetical protein
MFRQRKEIPSHLCNMKKWLILLILFQFRMVEAQNFTGELVLGISGTQVSGDQLQGFNKGGLIAGGGVRLHFNDLSSLGFRIQYFQKGSRKASDIENGDPTFYLMRLNYMEVPVLYRYNYKKFFLEAGPSVGVLVGNLEEDQDGEIPLRKEFKRLDISGAIGLGYTLSKKWHFSFDYYQSILPVRSHSGDAVYRLNRGQYNSAVTFNLIYNLKAGE